MGKKKNGKGEAAAGRRISLENKPVQRIEIFYYMLQEKHTAKELAARITCVPEDHIENWLELNLMEIVLAADSLIFQDAAECFIDPLDLAFLAEHQIQTVYEISFDTRDTDGVRQVMGQLLAACGGLLCADTETFEPVYTAENIETFTV